MIEKATVLIVGAGGSEPYGLPTGEQLTRGICSGINEAFDEVQENFNKIDAYELTNFGKQLLESRRSIDDWLSVNKTFKNYHMLGRYLISRYISMRERYQSFAKAQNIGRDWYAMLWDRIKPPLLEALENTNITIITFNYDRSLEQALFSMARSTFLKATNEECAEHVSKIPIIHVHGQLGKLPWQLNKVDLEGLPVRSYGSGRDVKLEIKCGGHIYFVDDPEAENRFIHARSAIQRAINIHFIGFGFLDRNLSRLRPKGDFHPEYVGSSSRGIGRWMGGSLSGTRNPFKKSINLSAWDDANEYFHNEVEGWQN